MYMSVRNIDVVSVPCEWSCICVSEISMLSLFLVVWSCICVSGISMLSLFLVSAHAYVCQEYRCCLCSLWVVMYMSVRNIDVVSVPCCVVMYMSVRNNDVVSVPCEWSCICLSGISMLSLFLVSGHVYVCQEYRCCFCSL
jgi:phosphatidylserine decarboxylase